MDQSIVQKIRIRARKISTQKPKQQKDETYKLQKILKIQTFWRMYAQRKKFIKLLKRKQKRFLVIEELKNTEAQYIKDLVIITDFVMIPIANFLEQQMFKMLFLNIKQIKNLHEQFFKQLIAELENVSQHKTMISKPILGLAPQLKKIYYKFCLEFKKSDQILRLLNMSNSQFKSFITKLRRDKILNLQLSSYLIKPIQRICKYSLLLNQLIKCTEQDHIDYQNLKIAMSTIQTIVRETNNQIQQFVKHQRLEQLHGIFGNIKNEGVKFIYEGKASIVNQQKQIEYNIYIFTNFLILSQNGTKQYLRFYFDETSTIKEAPPAKYFKNLLYLCNRKKTLTFISKSIVKKQQLYNILNSVHNIISKKQQHYVEIDVEGAEERQSLFKKYTVYIINVKKFQREFKIYPRFSQLIEVQQIIRKRLPNLDIPHLQKDDWFSSRKTKTIEMRKFIIKQFLMLVLNDPKIRTIDAVFKGLHLEDFIQSSLLKKNDQNIVSMQILVAGQKSLTCWISEKSKVFELKQKIAEKIGLKHPNEYQLFEIKDKTKKLIYQEELVGKLIPYKSRFLKIFQDKSKLSYTRYCYLRDEQEQNLYKEDLTRSLLELTIIRTQLQQLNLETDILMAIIALYSKFLEVDHLNDKKSLQYLYTFKTIRPNLESFRQYCFSIEEIIKKQNQYIPMIIIKFLNQVELYRCMQFHVEVYNKTLKQVKKQINLDQKIILGVKNNKIIFLTLKREIIVSFSYESITELNVYPTSLVFCFDNLKNTIRLDTNQSFEISKLIKHYNIQNKNPIITKNFQ